MSRDALRDANGQTERGDAGVVRWLAEETKSQRLQVGAPTKLRRILFCLSPRSLKSIVSEEICGFGSSSMDHPSYRASSDVHCRFIIQYHCLDGLWLTL
jgi:hypothetical protein